MLYAENDACTTITNRVMPLRGAVDSGTNLSLDEIDMIFRQFCTLSGCRERFMMLQEVCETNVSVPL